MAIVRKKPWTWALLLAMAAAAYQYSQQTFAGHTASDLAMPWQIDFEEPARSPAPTATDAESMFLSIHQLQSSGQRAQALFVAQDLVQQYPHFQLGQLLYADLLNQVSDRPADLQTWFTDQDPKASRRLQQLQQEAQLRLTRPDTASYTGKEPAGLAYFSDKLPYVVVVDAAHARLYVLGHSPAADPASPRGGLKVVFESYISVGQRGIGKQTEGDGRTPLGIYAIQKFMPGYALPDLYGSGALTLNYPNDIDLAQGKTGSGIWIHGSPSDQYARPPQATDGCVVLANPDMHRLAQLQLPAGTPVWIQPSIEWVSPQQNRALFKRLTAQHANLDAPEAGETLALLEWKTEAYNTLATVKSAPPLTPTPQTAIQYWIQEDGLWTLASTKSNRRPMAARSNAKVTATLAKL